MAEMRVNVSINSSCNQWIGCDRKSARWIGSSGYQIVQPSDASPLRQPKLRL
jgi:hypothetical protein